MNDDLLAYYNAELAYLRELGADFARKYPKVAGRLLLEDDKCADPHVERLLEGFSFLTARLRKKLDDELPEITDAFLNVCYPHYLRPVPSLTIVQFLPGGDASQLISGYKISPNARLVSRPVAGAPCLFRTAYPVTIWPIEVVAASLQPDRLVLSGKPSEAVGLLRLTLRCLPPASFATVKMDRLRFYLDGPVPLPYTFYELLLNQICRVWLRGTTAGGEMKTVTLPPDSIQPVGLGRHEGAIPYPDQAFVGYRLLQEYFALPEKYLFFDLVGLDRLAALDLGEQVDVLFFLKSAPRGEVLPQPENFRLGCTPAVNLFPLTAEPIVLDQTQTEYRVIPDVQRPLATEVYSVEQVTSVGSFLEEPITYKPFYALRHEEPIPPTPNRREQAYWFASRRPSLRKDDPGTDVYLTFVDRQFNPNAPASQTVTVQTLCTNRDLPARLPFGGEQGDFELESTAPVGRARCLKKPTSPLRPPTGRGAFWRLISHLSLNHLSLGDSQRGLEAFRALLSLYDFVESMVTRQQIEGITRVQSRRAAGRTGQAIGNSVCLGVETTIEFDEAQYVGSGAFLFATVLERFLGLAVSINSFSRLTATTKQREGILRRWPPRSGERTLL